nr:unnamed protein product [Digitaria exilis]
MDLFPDGQHVWLRSSGRGEKYLHADEGGVSVRVSSKRASPLSAWKVHHAVDPEDGETYVLLCSAAYGRYLTATRVPAPRGHKGRLVVQGAYNTFNSVAWRPERVGAGDGGDKVVLRHYSDHLLRANGEFFFWNKGISADATNRITAMSHWVVRAIPPRPFPPELPAAVLGPYRGSFLSCTKMDVATVVPGVPGRNIRFVRAADDGTFAPDPDDWDEFRFNGRSEVELRAAVAGALEEPNVLGIKLCARAGRFARPVPLTIDLPRHERVMEIVVLTEGSPAAVALQYPDIDAP